LGTSARIAVWPPENLGGACAAVDGVLDALDLQASRFRADSEICWIHRGGGGVFMLSDGLAEAVSVALAAARWTGGLADPTVGDALISLGYDRDFAAIDQQRSEPPAAPVPAPGWRTVQLDGPMLRLPGGVRLDLGATAKGLGADRAVRAAMAAGSQAGGVLVSLGGGIGVAGAPPRDGWPGPGGDGPPPAGSPHAQLVRLPRGAVATSSVTCRRWRRAGRLLHHIVDPRTGVPGARPWQTVEPPSPAPPRLRPRVRRPFSPAGPASLADHLARHGPPPSAGPGGRRREALIEEVRRAGLTGRGGAGVPTARKLAVV